MHLRHLPLIAILCSCASAAVDMKELDAAPAAAHGVRINVKADSYEAQVTDDGQVRILSGQTELIRNLLLTLNNKPQLINQITRQGDSVQLRAKSNGPDAPAIALLFLPQRIEITFPNTGLKGKDSGPNYELLGIFGDTAVSVKNDLLKQEDALPSRRVCSKHIFSFYGWYGHYWPQITVGYEDGRTMQISGIHGVDYYDLSGRDPYRPAEAKSRRGYFALKEIVQDKDPAKNTRVAIDIPKATPSGGVEPAPFFAIRPDKPRGVFYENEPVIYQLDFAKDYMPDGKWRLDWKLVDHLSQPAGGGAADIAIADGKATPAAITIPCGSMGYFRGQFELHREGGNSAAGCTSLPSAHPAGIPGAARA